MEIIKIHASFILKTLKRHVRGSRKLYKPDFLNLLRPGGQSLKGLGELMLDMMGGITAFF